MYKSHMFFLPRKFYSKKPGSFRYGKYQTACFDQTLQVMTSDPECFFPSFPEFPYLW